MKGHVAQGTLSGERAACEVWFSPARGCGESTSPYHKTLAILYKIERTQHDCPFRSMNLCADCSIHCDWCRSRPVGSRGLDISSSSMMPRSQAVVMCINKEEKQVRARVEAALQATALSRVLLHAACGDPPKAVYCLKHRALQPAVSLMQDMV